MKIFIYVLFIIIFIPIFMISCSIIGTGIGWLGKAKQVAMEQIDPAELLRKYEWFKDASAQLDQKYSSIKIFKKRSDDILAASDKSREDKEAYYLALSEVDGMKASYNQLAAEYNSQMAKINWRFCNVGQLPQGATTPLPREYKQYQEE